MFNSRDCNQKSRRALTRPAPGEEAQQRDELRRLNLANGFK